MEQDSFAFRLFSDPREFQRFSDSAGLMQPMAVNWSEHVVLCVVLKLHTNRLRFKSWSGPKDGTGELILYWEGIHPAYGNRFPALLQRVDRKDLKEVVVKIVNFSLEIGMGVEDKVITELKIPLPEAEAEVGLSIRQYVWKCKAP